MFLFLRQRHEEEIILDNLQISYVEQIYKDLGAVVWGSLIAFLFACFRGVFLVGLVGGFCICANFKIYCIIWCCMIKILNKTVLSHYFFFTTT